MRRECVFACVQKKILRPTLQEQLFDRPFSSSPYLLHNSCHGSLRKRWKDENVEEGAFKIFVVQMSLYFAD
jgi:hypothetical protein